MMDEFVLKAVPRYNIFAFIFKTIRILELCIALILFSWLLTRLPFAFALSAQFLRLLFAFAATPLAVFAVSNAIIAALLAQSRRHHSPDTLFRTTLTAVTTPLPEPHAPPPLVETEPEFHDKQVIVETVQHRPSAEAGASTNYGRSLSEKIREAAAKPPRGRQLQRPETEKRRENSPEIWYPQDNLSNEEFQRTIEAFIAKQLRFLREESSAIVIQNRS